MIQMGFLCLSLFSYLPRDEPKSLPPDTELDSFLFVVLGALGVPPVPVLFTVESLFLLRRP
jgi:hypothetical protein